MKIPCTHCNQSLEIPEELAGQTIECPACNASFDVPVIVTVPSATSQVQVAKQETKTTNVIVKSKASLPLKYLIAVCALVGLLSAFLFKDSGDDTNQKISSNKIKTYDKEFSEFIANQDLPKMVDKSTRADSMKFLDDLSEAQYKFTIIDKLKNEVDSKILIATSKPNVLYNYLVQDEMKTMRDMGMNLKYSYYDKNSNFIFNFTVRLNEIIAPNNISTSERPLYCFVNEKNKHLPIMLDHLTELEKLSLHQGVLTSIYNLINLRKSDVSPNFGSIMKEVLINGSQEDPVMKMMLDNGVVFKHVYNINDEVIAEIIID